MANVSFEVTAEASAAFLAAQDDRSVRSLTLAIEDEAVVLKGTSQGTADAGVDFDGLFAAAGLGTDAAAFVLFCDDEGAAAAGARHWVLLAWVPDACRPKDKMLYSSSRDSTKRQLGAGLFGQDYYCNEPTDLSWAAYQKSTKDVGGGPLSEVEQLKKDEAALERDTSTRSNAMGDLPFEVLPAAAEALAAFAAAGGPGVLALGLDNEKVSACASPSVPSAEALASGSGLLSAALENKAEPAYLLTRLPGAAEAAACAFVYYCPDEAPVKLKMVYSTAKATVMAAAGHSSIGFVRIEEVRSTEDLDALAAPAPAVPEDGAAAAPPPAGGADLGTRAAPPGRSRPRTQPKKKFIADSD